MDGKNPTKGPGAQAHREIKDKIISKSPPSIGWREKKVPGKCRAQRKEASRFGVFKFSGANREGHQKKTEKKHTQPGNDDSAGTRKLLGWREKTEGTNYIPIERRRIEYVRVEKVMRNPEE